MKKLLSNVFENWIIQALDLLTMLLFVYTIIGVVVIAQYSIPLFYVGFFLSLYLIIRVIIKIIVTDKKRIQKLNERRKEIEKENR